MLSLSTFFKVAFGYGKKYWQILVGFFTFVFLYILKAKHDSGIKKETIKEIEVKSAIETANQQQTLNEASEAALISHANNPLPDTWDDLSKLSKKANYSPASKAAKDKVLKKLRRKN